MLRIVRHDVRDAMAVRPTARTAAPRECRQHEEGLLLHRAIFGTWCDPGDGTLCVLPCIVSMGCEACHRGMVVIMNFEEAAKVRWVGRKERRDKE